jgi:hypothetical protein
MELRYPVAGWRGVEPPEVAERNGAVIDITDRAPGAPDGAVGRSRLVIGAGAGCVAGFPAGVHFGVSGPWDGDPGEPASKRACDGTLCQWLPIGVGDVLVLTSDGGDTKRLWSAKQLDALVALGAWWCRQLDVAPRLVRTDKDSGLAVAGPLVTAGPLAGDAVRTLGSARLAQLADVVLPGIAATLRRPANPPEAAVEPGAAPTATGSAAR